jgi:L-threonylcarbamoyladenylate synthase
LLTSQVRPIVQLLRSGGVVVLPTDTLFGLAGCLQPDVLQRIYHLKGRDTNKPLALLVNGINQIKQLVKPTEAQLDYARRLLPGPVTCIFPGTGKLSQLHSAYSDGVALRWLPGSPVSTLLEALDEPLFLTSANLAGAPDPTSLSEITPSIRKGVDCVCFPETEVEGKPSALVDLRVIPPSVSRSELTLEQLLHD